jgi:GT2 family glycosyltransferase
VTDLSIVIVTWNARDVLLDCLESIGREVLSRRDPGRLDVEVLVVDNGSTDGSVEAVQERFPFAEVVALPRNLGFAAGNNVGLRRAKGRYAVLLNSDTIVLRDGLEKCVRYLDDHPDVGVVGPQLLNPDGSKQNCIHNYPSLVTELVPKGLLERFLPRRFPSKRFDHPGPIEVEAVLGACLVVRREVLEQVGLMPEDYFFFLEETDWCFRIRRGGWRVAHLPESRIVHIHGVSTKKKIPAETRIEYHRSLYHFFRKNRGVAQATCVVLLRTLKAVFHVLVDAPAMLWSARARQRWRARWKVLSWHLRGCPAQAGLARLRGAEGGSS